MDFGDLGDTLSNLRSNLGGLGDALGNLGGNALKAALGLKNLGSASQTAGDSAKAAASSIASTSKDAAGAIKQLGGAIKSVLTGEVPSAMGAMTALGSALGGALTSGADKAASALKMLGPEGEAAGVALQGLAAVASATIGTLTMLMGLAIQSAQGAQLMKDRFAALAGSAAGGKAVQASIAKLAATLPFASSQVNSWAQSLLAAGVKGKQLEDDIKAIAAATALMGEGGGAAAETLFKRLGEGGPAADKLLKTFKDGGPKADKLLKEMGLSIKDLGGEAALAKMTAEDLHKAIAKAMAKKGAGPLADMALTFPAILQKAQEGLRSLFGGLEGPVKAFMTSVKGLFGEFNKGSPLIKQLKPTVTALMTTLFSWGTKAANAIRDILRALAGTGKPGALSSIVGILKAIFTNKYALDGLVAALKAIGIVAGVLIGIFLAVTAVWGALAAGIASAVGFIVGLFGELADSVSGFGGSIIDGLVGGLDFGAFVERMAAGARAGLQAFKSVLGIASPSKVMLEHGEEDIAGAAAMGVEAGTPKVAKAMNAMGDQDAGTPKGRGRGGAGSGGERHYHYHGPMSDWETFKKYVARYWEEAELEAGSAPEPA